MIVASFFAPRYEKWEGCDYDALLGILQASCDRLGLSHVCISDQPRPGVATALMPLPDNLMQAIIAGQWRFLGEAREPVLFVGADCVLTRDPRDVGAGDLTVTIGPFGDCPMNTGAMWVMDPAKCAPVWKAALDMAPVEWGDDQTSLLRAIRASGLDVREVRCEAHNWAPQAVDDAAGMPTVAHFRGDARKRFMGEWFDRHVRSA